MVAIGRSGCDTGSSSLSYLRMLYGLRLQVGEGEVRAGRDGGHAGRVRSCGCSWQNGVEDEPDQGGFGLCSNWLRRLGSAGHSRSAMVAASLAKSRLLSADRNAPAGRENSASATTDQASRPLPYRPRAAGRASGHRSPEAASSNRRLQPAAFNALACKVLFCSSPLDTRDNRAGDCCLMAWGLSQTAVCAWKASIEAGAVAPSTILRKIAAAG